MAKKAAPKHPKQPKQKAESAQPKAGSSAAVAEALTKSCDRMEEAQKVLGIMCKATAHSSFLNRKLVRVQKALDKLAAAKGDNQ